MLLDLTFKCFTYSHGIIMILSRLATNAELNDGYFHLLISISYIIVLYFINIYIYIFINHVTKKKSWEKTIYNNNNNI